MSVFPSGREEGTQLSNVNAQAGNSIIATKSTSSLLTPSRGGHQKGLQNSSFLFSARDYIQRHGRRNVLTAYLGEWRRIFLLVSYFGSLWSLWCSGVSYIVSLHFSTRENSWMCCNSLNNCKWVRHVCFTLFVQNLSLNRRRDRNRDLCTTYFWGSNTEKHLSRDVTVLSIPGYR